MDNLTKNIERMMEPYREIEKMTEPIRKMQKQLSASTLAMRKAIEPTLELQKRLEQPLLNFQKSFEHLNKIYGQYQNLKIRFWNIWTLSKKLVKGLKNMLKKHQNIFY